jgi:signal transduction histidine kinase
LALRRPRDSEEYRRAIESVAIETQRLETLTDELLAAARSDVDARGRERLDAASVAAEVGERIRVAALERDICVVVDTGARMYVDAHRATLERALLAIAHNAIQHAPNGGTVRLDVREAGGDINIAVRDDGPGFSHDALAHATERFWRENSARTRGGTGLGLTIADTLVNANGGRLGLNNSADGGAIVTIALHRSDDVR